MKFLKRYIIPGLSMAMFMGFAACSSNDGEPSSTPGDNSVIPAEGATISFHFQMENEVATRGVNGYDGGLTGLVGTGTKIDYLIFAIYDEDGKLLDKFDVEDPDEYSKLDVNGKTINVSDGQYVLAWPNSGVELSAMPAGNYTIVCWAQSSACAAYDTSDLTNVKVSYVGALNNDETRDAFCAAEDFTVSANGQNTTVVLTRPFAQINVGTTGADFKMSARIPGGTYYTYSEISLTGVASAYNVLTGNTVGGTSQATFSFNKIPAYWDMEMPALESELVETSGEDYLIVDLDKDGQYKGYKTTYSTVGNDGSYLTETFKYMSMCYVLVPTTATNDGATGSTLSEVTLTFSGDENGNPNPTKYVNTSFTLNKVPVKQNYRTNILGGLTWINPSTVTYPGGDDPNDPNNPGGSDPNNPGGGDPNDPNNPGGGGNDDPDEIPDYPGLVVDDLNTLFSSATANVIIITDYFKPDNNEILDNTPVSGN